MPIPLESLERAVIPRVLTPATTVAELLYLFADQPLMAAASRISGTT
jgi:hypothetical protein